jgi:hypothetical protein
MNDLTFGATLLSILALLALCAWAEVTQPPPHPRHAPSATVRISDVPLPPEENAELHCGCATAAR